MCTTGVLVTREASGEQRIFGVKTSDSALSGYWHGIVHHPGGYDALSYGIIPQQGINAGMNEAGLILLSSYFDARQESADEREMNNRSWGRDVRGMLQAHILAHMSTVEEALSYFYEQIPQYPGTTGGNHVMADSRGKVAVFEHCRGQYSHQDSTDEGWVARGNQALCIWQDAQRELPHAVQQDRNRRWQVLNNALRQLKEAEGMFSREQIRERLKEVLSSHAPEGKEAPGTICSHGVEGVRSNLPDPHFTLSGMIWEAEARVMYYTEGEPCCHAWKSLSLPERKAMAL